MDFGDSACPRDAFGRALTPFRWDLDGEGISTPSKMRGARRTRSRPRAAGEAMRSPTSLETRAHRSSTRETFPCLADERFEEVRRSRTLSFHPLRGARSAEPRRASARLRTISGRVESLSGGIRNPKLKFCGKSPCQVPRMCTTLVIRAQASRRQKAQRCNSEKLPQWRDLDLSPGCDGPPSEKGKVK